MENNTSQTSATTGFFSDLLTVLHVPHTRPYSEQRFMTMPFMSMFGVSKLLQEYGVESEGITVTDAVTGQQRDEIALKLPVPYVAVVRCGQWVIVTSVDADAHTVTYMSQGEKETAPADTFTRAWNGKALLCKTGSNAREPDFALHKLAEYMTVLRDRGLWVGLFLILVLAMSANGFFSSVPTVLLVMMNLLGLTVSYMLAQKTVGVHTRVADRVCSAIQEHGCDHVLDTGGTFLGIFHWSEVGLGYFSVSLLALLMGGCEMLPWLALFNLCCLPYSLWSVWYQRFRAHAWCTLCLTVQCTLWILAGLYLWAGAWNGLHEFSVWAVVLLLAYITTVLGLNKIMQSFNKSNS